MNPCKRRGVVALARAAVLLLLLTSISWGYAGAATAAEDGPDYTAYQGTTLHVPASQGAFTFDETGYYNTLLGVCTTKPCPDDQTVYSATTSQGGTITTGSDGHFTYEPKAGFHGTDTFGLTLRHFIYEEVCPRGGCHGDPDLEVTVSIYVNGSPVADTVAETVQEDSSLTFDAGDHLSDPENETITISDHGDPTRGTMSELGAGRYIYTPDANYVGPDAVTFTVSDGHTSAQLPVRFSVTSVNDAPAAADDVVRVVEDAAADLDVLDNDTDVDGDTLTVTDHTEPHHGTVSTKGDGLVYTPDADWSGTDTFSYTASDPDGATDTASVTVTVAPANDAPIAGSPRLAATEDTTLMITGAALVSDATDVDGDPIRLYQVDGDPRVWPGSFQPLHGTVNDVRTLSGPRGQMIAVDYVPDPDFHGVDTITFALWDGASDGIVEGTATIVVRPVNDPPVAMSDSYDVFHGLLEVDATHGLLANDTDDGGPVSGVVSRLALKSGPALALANAGTLTAALVDAPEHGTLTLAPDGGFRYVGDPGYTGADSFGYLAADGQFTSAVQRVHLAVTATPSGTSGSAAPPAASASATTLPATGGPAHLLDLAAMALMLVLAGAAAVVRGRLR